MDGESFDRLSVMVNRLRDRSTRRGVLGAVLGGVLAAGFGLLGDDAEARRNRNRKRCRGYGGRCDRNKDCCDGNCRNGICWFGGGGGGGGGGRRCGGRTCPNGWRCCRQNGISVCTPNTFPTCCGGNSYIPGYRCCSGSFGGACPIGQDCCGDFNQCCQSGWKCCENRTCIPNNFDCDDFFPLTATGQAVGTESRQAVPSEDPATVDESDWISLAE